jgi:hypothetical protein
MQVQYEFKGVENKMNRLLSEQEICLNCPISSSCENREDCEYYGGAEDAAKTQLTKTDKEWVEWVVIESAVIRLGDEQGELANGDYIAIPAERWRERRKEIGL